MKYMLIGMMFLGSMTTPAGWAGMFDSKGQSPNSEARITALALSDNDITVRLKKLSVNQEEGQEVVEEIGDEVVNLCDFERSQFGEAQSRQELIKFIRFAMSEGHIIKVGYSNIFDRCVDGISFVQKKAESRASL